jgi:hypothetical protein
MRSQYVAASYLVTACEEAMQRLSTLSERASRRSQVPERALATITSVHADWCAALAAFGQMLAHQGEDGESSTFTPS